MTWQAGKVDVDARLETFGTGVQLLTNASAEGSFSGTAIEVGTLPLRSVAGGVRLFLVAGRTAPAPYQPESAHRG